MKTEKSVREENLMRQMIFGSILITMTPLQHFRKRLLNNTEDGSEDGSLSPLKGTAQTTTFLLWEMNKDKRTENNIKNNIR